MYYSVHGTLCISFGLQRSWAPLGLKYWTCFVNKVMCSHSVVLSEELMLLRNKAVNLFPDPDSHSNALHEPALSN